MLAEMKRRSVNSVDGGDAELGGGGAADDAGF